MARGETVVTCSRCEKGIDQPKQICFWTVCEDCFKEMEGKVFFLREEEAVPPCPLCGNPQIAIVVDNMEKPIHPADYQMVKGMAEEYEKDTGRRWEHFPHLDVEMWCESCCMFTSHVTVQSEEGVDIWIEAEAKRRGARIGM